MRFEKTVTLGNIIQILTFLIMFIVMLLTMRADINQLKTSYEQHEKRHERENATQEREHDLIWEKILRTP